MARPQLLTSLGIGEGVPALFVALGVGVTATGHAVFASCVANFITKKVENLDEGLDEGLDWLLRNGDWQKLTAHAAAGLIVKGAKRSEHSLYSSRNSPAALSQNLTPAASPSRSSTTTATKCRRSTK